MGKFKDGVNTAGTRVFNTVATPVRIGGGVGNALGNVLRQGQSSAKNTAEVAKQTIDALVDNFLNFSKVEGKWYQRLTKGAINLASAVTRRPAMIAGAGVLSTLNQGIWKPFTKLAPGKLFKDIENAFRLFSKKKGFDFQTYDTHETKGDTRINQIKEKRIGFFGKGGAASSKAEEKSEKPSETKKEEPKVEKKPESKIEPKPDTKPDVKPDAKPDKPQTTPVVTPPSKPDTKPTSIDALKEHNKNEAAAKDVAENKKMYPDRKTMNEKFKKEYIKDYEKVLGGKKSEEGILERGKNNKKGENIDQIMITVKKENPTMAGYFDELLAKQTPAKAA